MEKKIYYHDTDAIGIVYHGAYLNLLEEARTEFFHSKGILVNEMHEQKKYFVIKKFNISYRNPAGYGDIIICDIEVDKITDARIFLKQKIFHKQSKQILLESEVVLVLLNEYLKPILLPEKIKLLLYEKKEV